MKKTTSFSKQIFQKLFTVYIVCSLLLFIPVNKQKNEELNSTLCLVKNFLIKKTLGFVFHNISKFCYKSQRIWPTRYCWICQDSYTLFWLINFYSKSVAVPNFSRHMTVFFNWFWLLCYTSETLADITDRAEEGSSWGCGVPQGIAERLPRDREPQEGEERVLAHCAGSDEETWAPPDPQPRGRRRPDGGTVHARCTTSRVYTR